MASFTTPKTWAAGPLTAAEMDEQVSSNIQWLKDALTTHGITSDSVAQALLGARYAVSVTQTEDVNDDVDKAIQFATEEFDDFDGHDPGSNPGRITVPVAGSYLVISNANFATSSNGRRDLWIEANGNTEWNRVNGTANNNATKRQTTSALIPLAAGEYVRTLVRQSSGSTLSCTARMQLTRFSV